MDGVSEAVVEGVCVAVTAAVPDTEGVLVADLEGVTVLEAELDGDVVAEAERDGVTVGDAVLAALTLVVTEALGLGGIVSLGGGRSATFERIPGPAFDRLPGV
jgi:hypothetical protein